MYSMNQSEQIKTPKANKEPRWKLRLFKRLSVAATALLSLLGTVEANSANDQGPLKIYFESTSAVPGVKNTESILGAHDVMPGEGVVPALGYRSNLVDISTYQRQEDGSWKKVEVPVNQSFGLTYVQPMEYARLFDSDPNARQAIDGAEQVKLAAKSIVEIANDSNYTIKSIKITGNSSAEGNPGEPDAGLWIDNPENVRLANERAVGAKDMLIKELELAGVVDKIPQITTSGEELLDPALNQNILELAKDRGEDPYNMLFNWSQRNNLGSFSQEDLELLEKFAEHRRSVIVMEVVKHTAEEMVYQKGKWVEGAERNEEGSVVIIFLPLWLPRRKKTSESDGEQVDSEGNLSPANKTAEIAGGAKFYRGASGKVPGTFGILDRLEVQSGGLFATDMAMARMAFRLSPELMGTTYDVGADGSMGGDTVVEPITVTPSPFWLPKDPESNGPKQDRHLPPKKLGKEIHRQAGATGRHNKQPTWLNDGAGQGTSRYGRHR